MSVCVSSNHPIMQCSWHGRLGDVEYLFIIAARGAVVVQNFFGIDTNWVGGFSRPEIGPRLSRRRDDGTEV